MAPAIADPPKRKPGRPKGSKGKLNPNAARKPGRPRLHPAPEPEPAKKQSKEARYRQKLRATDADYNDRERVRNMERNRKVRQEGREIVIPAVVDPERRASCEWDLPKFCREYFPHYTYLPFAPYQLEILQEFQQAMVYGGKQSVAAPRGGGKDTLLGMAVIWAIGYGHKKYVAYIGPDLDSAGQKLGNIKYEIETNPHLMEDFPEMCAPIVALEGASQRARTQRTTDEDGESYLTRPVWAVDQVVFAAIKGAPCAGSIIQTAGILNGCRGLNVGGLRPDIAVLNDIETSRAAVSEAMQKSIESEIDQGLAGLGGPGKSVASFMLCTIFAPNCAADKYTDRTRKPSWNGRRYRAVIEMPRNLEMWEQYMKYRQDGQARDRNNDRYGEEATWYYLLHKEQMEEGSIVAWEHRFNPQILPSGNKEEHTALQNIYNQIADNGWDFFYSELQNDPQPADKDAFGLTSKTVRSRCGGYQPGIIPWNAVRVTEGIDVGAYEIHHTTWAWLEDGTPFIVDYGTVKVDAPKGDLRSPDSPVRKALEQAILDALRLRRGECEGEGYLDSNGVRRTIDLHCVDGNAWEDVVAKFCRESGPTYRLTKGEGTLQGQKRYTEPVDKQKRRVPHHHYYKVKNVKGYIVYRLDADHWKKFCQLRFAQDPGAPGAAQLWGMEPSNHRVYANHICAEIWNIESGKFEKVNPHNHFLDASAYACAAAHMVGVRVRSDVAMMEHKKAPDMKAESGKADNPAPDTGKRTYDHRQKKLSMRGPNRGGPRQTKGSKSAW